MVPLRISMKGFMSYRDEQVLRFDGASLWVLLGRNGAGKSAVFDAMTFALYGRHSRHHAKGQLQQDLINHQETSGCVVEFDFAVNGESYRAQRTLPRNGAPTRTLCRLLPDGRPEPIPGTHKEQAFSAEIEGLIGLDFRAFTSSVLLVQGQSERLLQEDPSDRYRILSQLIDLLPFQRLHELANDRRKEYEQEVKSIRGRLGTLEQVSEEELAEARERSGWLETDFKAAQASADKLRQLSEQAKQWQVLVRYLGSEQEKLDAHKALLEREREIRDGLNRLRELASEIDDLKKVVALRSRLEVLFQSLGDLGARRDLQQAELTAAEAEEDEAQQALGAANKEIEILRDEREQLLNRMTELEATVAVLNRWQETGSKLRGLEEDLRRLTSDLPDTCAEARKRQALLRLAETAGPWLHMVAHNRRNLAAACRDEREAAAADTQLESQMKANISQREKLYGTRGTLEKRASELAHANTRAKTLEEQIEQKRTQFEEAADKAVCGLCGQAISPEHAARERAELLAQLGDVRSKLTELRAEIDGANELLSSVSSELAGIEAEITRIEGVRNERQRIRDRAADQIQAAVLQLKSAFGALSEDERSDIGPGLPPDASGWLATVYPTDDDLRDVDARAEEAKRFEKRVEQLESELLEWQRIDILRGDARTELSRLEASLDLDEALAARSEHETLDARRTQVQGRLASIGDDAEGIKVRLEGATARVDELRAALRKIESDLNNSLGTREEVERNLQAAIQGVAPSHREAATVVTPATLCMWEDEHDRLAKYETLARELDQALSEQERTEARMDEIRSVIATFDEAARHQPHLLEQEWSQAIAERDRADGCRKEAVRALTEIQQQHKQRKETEESLRENERQSHLYGLLAQLLGPEGLQMYLLRRAERAIVAYANEILDGLSRGRLQLDFRSDDTDADQPKKALDLTVLDRDSGATPVPVHLTSGSQRFRIAVSLALAIGRYTGQGARRIESVIIDEGFGSLDRDGRDDMIEELNELQEQLQRIILVSHQEEFASAFRNGYRVELEDGASRAQPWSE
jgi:DNA repair protein SbcC/Rad50